MIERANLVQSDKRNLKYKATNSNLVLVELTRRTLGDVRVPTVQQYSNAMITMKKDKGFLVNHSKESVN
jgi:hypothetical protein